MIFRLPVSRFLLCAFMALFFAAGCDRVDQTPVLQEADEPGYRRARELVRQGNHREALLEFNKVLAKRGLNNAPETHLDMAIIYQQHMRDHIAAIFHFGRYLQHVAPNSKQAETVRQYIKVSEREFLRNFPGRPSIDALTDVGNTDNADRIASLQRENDNLRSALKAAQAAAGIDVSSGLVSRSPVTAASPSPVTSALQGDVVVQTQNPAGNSADNSPSPQQQQQSQPRQQFAPSQAQQQTQQQVQQARSPSQTQQQTPPPQSAGRRYVVQAKDSLYSIARQYYGSVTNAQIDAIVNANRDKLQSRDTPLKQGWELRIP